MMIQINRRDQKFFKYSGEDIRARLRSARGEYGKVAFVPSPQTQQQVQQQAQEGQVEVKQDGNSNAVSPGGITIDDVVGMLEQMHQELTQSLVGIQNQISEMRAALPAPEGDGKGEKTEDTQLKERVAQLEQMLNGMQSQAAQGEQAAQTGVVQ